MDVQNNSSKVNYSDRIRIALLYNFSAEEPEGFKSVQIFSCKAVYRYGYTQYHA